jgi:hypothetical protein
MYMSDWEANEGQQEHEARVEANRCYEDAMQAPIDSNQDFDQSLSLADAFILHALGVKVALYPEW